MELLREGQWKRLEKLNLNFNYLGREGLRLLEGNNWKGLKVLSLLSNGITNQGVSSIVKMQFPVLD